MSLLTFRILCVAFLLSALLPPLTLGQDVIQTMADDTCACLEKKLIEDYSQAIALNGTEIVYYTNRALAYMDLLDYEQALKDYEVVIPMDSSNAEHFDMRAFIKTQLGDTMGAIDDYSTSLVLYPEDPSILVERGKLHIEVEQIEAACSDFEKARELLYPEIETLLEQHCE